MLSMAHMLLTRQVRVIVGGRMHLIEEGLSSSSSSSSSGDATEAFLTGFDVLRERRLPPSLRERFLCMEEDEFRRDVSSTELRKRQQDQQD